MNTFRMQGNKRKILDYLVPQFNLEGKRLFVDLFAGMLSVSLRVKKDYPEIDCIANDNSKFIYNLFLAIKNKKSEIEREMLFLPHNQDVFFYYKTLLKEWNIDDIDDKNCNPEIAIGFLYCLYNSLYSSCNTFLILLNNNCLEIMKDEIRNFMLQVDEIFSKIKIVNLDYSNVLDNISSRKELCDSDVFIYCDPPYIGTRGIALKSHQWNLSNLENLILYCITTKKQFGISEFSGNDVLNLVKKMDLNIKQIKTRRSCKSKETEILITNY